ncbi:MAG: polymer-forming cytoskeletal protein [Hyphomicrobiales bacterium]|nr:polymer-forming cytoskeletal protein [Hyphomicrobiales bacterium]
MSNFDAQKPITKTTSAAVGSKQPMGGQGMAANPSSMNAPSGGLMPGMQSGALVAKTPSFRGQDRMSPSIIGEDLTVTGNVLSRGEVQVDGQIQGDVHCSSLIVGEKAQITGGIVAEDVVVRGRVMGSVRGMRVTLQASSHVEGDVFHQSLAIEQGAYFEGKSRRSEDPIASAPKLENMGGHNQAAE